MDLRRCRRPTTSIASADPARAAGVREFFVPLEDVRRNLRSTGYPSAQLVFVRGKIEETIPGTAPTRIALLRLDADWFSSTSHALTHLFPRVAVGGIIIFDDMGHWRGAQTAVRQYFQTRDSHPFLHRIDYTGRILVKTSP